VRRLGFWTPAIKSIGYNVNYLNHYCLVKKTKTEEKEVSRLNY